MKKYLFSLFLLFFVYNLQSQVLIALLLGDKLNTGKIDFGLDGGWNFSNISDLDADKWDNAFNLGFYFDIKLKDQWLLNTGVLVKGSLGVKELSREDLVYLNSSLLDYENELNENGTYEQNISYFIVPVLAKYVFKNNFYLEAGPQVALMHKAWLEYNYEIDGNSTQIKEDNKDDVNRLDFGFTGGAGYRLLDGMGWTVGVRYYHGITNVYKVNSGQKNSALFLKLNVPIGTSQEKKDEIKDYKVLLKEKKDKKKDAKKLQRADNKKDTNI